jgi:chromosome segregation ATPase
MTDLSWSHVAAKFSDILALLPKLSVEQRLALEESLLPFTRSKIHELEQERDAALRTAAELEEHREYNPQLCEEMEKERDAAIARAKDTEDKYRDLADEHEARMSELEAERIRLLDQRDAQRARVTELEGKLAGKNFAATDELNRKLRTQVASMASAQREACAEYVKNMFDGAHASPRYVRETPLVTDTPAPLDIIDQPGLRSKCSRQRREPRRLNQKQRNILADVADLARRAAELGRSASAAYEKYVEARAELSALRAEIEKLRAREAPELEPCFTCGENPRVRNERIECYISDATAAEILAAEQPPQASAETSRCTCAAGNLPFSRVLDMGCPEHGGKVER